MKKNHDKHVWLILEKLCERGFYAKPKKCLFHQTEMEFLGFITTMECLKMDPKKVEAIVSWEVPKTIRDVQYFLGFASIYWNFIKIYSLVATPRTRLTCKNNLDWGLSAKKAFQDLKAAFTTVPILVHPDFTTAF